MLYEIEPLRILVADDNKVNQLVIGQVLKNLGISPMIVDNGALARSACEEENYDVVFMDLYIPVMGGRGDK